MKLPNDEPPSSEDLFSMLLFAIILSIMALMLTHHILTVAGVLP